MTYKLYRVTDNAGDCGPMSHALRRMGEGLDGIEYNGHRPLVGYNMQVGSPYARTYEQQDYWTTTRVTEILEDRGNYVRFKTGNSEYIWEEV
jgi:hypothetical protein